MTEFRIISRGEGVAQAIGEGYFRDEGFAQLLNHAPSPLLEPDDLARLRHFLEVVPARKDRRTKTQQEEAESLAALVRAGQAEALCEEAKEILALRVEGKAFRGRGRPKASKAIVNDRLVLLYLAIGLKHSIEKCLGASLPLEIPNWGPVNDYPEFYELPLKTRALHMAHAALRDRGFRMPSVSRLRNQMAEVDSYSREFIVKARDSEAG